MPFQNSPWFVPERSTGRQASGYEDTVPKVSGHGELFVAGGGAGSAGSAGFGVSLVRVGGFRLVGFGGTHEGSTSLR